MQPVLFDSSIYITGLGMGDEAALALKGWLRIHRCG